MGSVVAVMAGFLFRVLQVAVESSLYLLIGFVVAGGLRALIEPARLRRFFGTGRFSGPLRACALATVLVPVCSLGVLPVLEELRRARVRRDAILTFALAAPVFNPVSVLYGVSYLGVNLLTSLILGAVFVAIAAGMLCGPSRSDDGNEPALSNEESALASTGTERLRAAARHALRAASGPVFLDVAVGIVVAGLTSAFLNPSTLSESMFADDARAIPLMTAIALPSYVTPEKGIATLPEMLKFRQSSGAMFCLIVLGVGVSAGQLRWVARSYHPLVAVRWACVIVALSVAGAYALDFQFPPVGTVNSDNDHFAEFGNEFDSAHVSSRLPLVGRYLSHVGMLHWATLTAVAALSVIGALMRQSRGIDHGPTGGHASLPPTAHASPRVPSLLDLELPRWLISSVAAATTLFGLGVGLYAFYPAPAETFRDMTIIKADYYGELNAESNAAPLHHLELWDRQVARLFVGSLIRLSWPDEKARHLTRELRTGIQRLRHATEIGKRDEARRLFGQLQSTVTRCRAAYGAG